MRSRVPRSPGKALAAGATAALLGLSMAGSAAAAGPTARLFSPSGGTPLPTSTSCTGFAPAPAQGCAMAGYQARGRDFRYAQAVITVPDHNGMVTTCPPGADCAAVAGPGRVRRGAIRGTPLPAESDPQIYVALAGSPDGTGGPPGSTGESPGITTGKYARVGVRPCTGGAPCGTSGWEAFAQVADAGSPPVSGHGTAPAAVLFPIAASQEGDGVFVSVYADPAGHSVHTVITLPDGSTFNNDFAVTGPVYTRAQAVADWTTAAVKPQPVAPLAKVRDTQFLEGRFTTANGQQGTFAGPWALNAFEGTSNGDLPPAGTLVVQPSYLWNDETNFHGRFGDAFGVWRFPF
jgi:hypothetical protein